MKAPVCLRVDINLNYLKSSMKRKSDADLGAVGAVIEPFIFSIRDLQQQIKNQSWLKADCLKALQDVLTTLESKF